MVWLHGGGFYFESSDNYQPDVLVVTEDVVVVTINYRLNSFGFLTTGDDTFPGNYGLWDQKLAMQWVKDNIADYGGDPESITLFGESAGGRSVSFQMMTPTNPASLFHRGIVESGSSVSLTYINRNPMPVFSTFVELVGCSTSSDLMSCLRSKSVSNLLEAGEKISRPFPFFPIVDGEFLPHDFGLLLANFTINPRDQVITQKVGNFKHYDLMGGWNNQEGLYYLSILKKIHEKTANTDYSQGISREVLKAALEEYPFHNYAGDDRVKSLITEMFINFYTAQPRSLSASERESDDKQRVEIFTEISGLQYEQLFGGIYQKSMGLL